MSELEKLRAENQRLRAILKTTQQNIISIKACVGESVITYDKWLSVINDALTPPDDHPELF